MGVVILGNSSILWARNGVYAAIYQPAVVSVKAARNKVRGPPDAVTCRSALVRLTEHAGKAIRLAAVAELVDIQPGRAHAGEQNLRVVRGPCSF